MLLSRENIHKHNLVVGASESNYRAASYDLRVGHIITPSAEEKQSYTIPPQGIVEVVSMERLNLPENISGYALVKNSLSNSGILAINIGIIDPCYRGKISSTLINFGKNPYVICRGDTFIRAAFQSCEEIGEPNKVMDIDDDQYIRDKKNKVASVFSNTFLDIHTTASKAAEEAFGKYKQNLFVWVPIAALMVAIFTFLMNFGNVLLTQGFLQPNATVQAEMLRNELVQQRSSFIAENNALRAKVEALDLELAKLRAGVRP